MYKRGIGDLKYYVGISSLAQVATRADRVRVRPSQYFSTAGCWDVLPKLTNI